MTYAPMHRTEPSTYIKSINLENHQFEKLLGHKLKFINKVLLIFKNDVAEIPVFSSRIDISSLNNQSIYICLLFPLMNHLESVCLVVLQIYCP